MEGIRTDPTASKNNMTYTNYGVTVRQDTSEAQCCCIKVPQISLSNKPMSWWSRDVKWTLCAGFCPFYMQ